MNAGTGAFEALTAPPETPPRPLPQICAEACRVPCPLCRARFAPCVTTGTLGTAGNHVARFAVAYRAELVTAAELLRVTTVAQVFTGSTVVFTSGGAR